MDKKYEPNHPLPNYERPLKKSGSHKGQKSLEYPQSGPLTRPQQPKPTSQAPPKQPSSKPRED